MTDPTTCPLCGANWSNTYDFTCADYFHEMIALEFIDPIAGAVHHLTVTCYMIQHDGYSDEALAEMQKMLEAVLEQGEDIQHYRQRMRPLVDSGKRTIHITRAPDAPPLPRRPWTMTIVDAGGDLDVAGYQARVTAWGQSVLKTLKET